MIKYTGIKKDKPHRKRERNRSFYRLTLAEKESSDERNETLIPGFLQE